MSSSHGQPAAPAFPHLSHLEEQLFEAFAAGCTAPAALAARLNLPIKSILLNLASPAFLEAIHVLDSVTALLNRHSTRFRQQTAFQALEQALALATQAGNPTVMCRIATQLLKPTPPLPDAELEHVERAERITKSRRAVKDDAKTEAEDAEYEALAAEMVPIPALDKLRAARANVPSASVPSASSRWSPPPSTSNPTPTPAAPNTRPGREPVLTPVTQAPNQPTAPAPTTKPSQSTTSPSSPLVTPPLVTPLLSSPPLVTSHSAARPQAA